MALWPWRSDCHCHPSGWEPRQAPVLKDPSQDRDEQQNENHYLIANGSLFVHCLVHFLGLISPLKGEEDYVPVPEQLSYLCSRRHVSPLEPPDLVLVLSKE